MAPLRALDDFQADLPPRPQAPHPCRQGTRVGLIGPDTPQPRALVLQACQQAFRTGTVLHVRRRDRHGQ